MKQLAQRLASLMFGLILYALGIAFTLKANIGYAPWEVFHAGVSHVTGIRIGMVSILVGIVVILISVLLKETVGLGTILNMIVVGTLLDLILLLDFLPTADSLAVGVLMLIAGMFVIAIGTYFYMRAAFGAGPRDSLMVSFTRKTGIPVGVCRTSIELVATLIGWLLGGQLGIGTVISVVGIGFCIQLTFKLFHFDVTAVEHQTFRKKAPAVEEAACAHSDAERH